MKLPLGTVIYMYGDADLIWRASSLYCALLTCRRLVLVRYGEPGASSRRLDLRASTSWGGGGLACVG